MYFIFKKCTQILAFDTRSSQIAKTFLWSFSQTFGLAYSPLISATLSFSSEVTLFEIWVLLKYVPKNESESLQALHMVRKIQCQTTSFSTHLIRRSIKVVYYQDSSRHCALNYCNVELLALDKARSSTLQYLSKYNRLLGT